MEDNSKRTMTQELEHYKLAFESLDYGLWTWDLLEDKFTMHYSWTKMLGFANVTHLPENPMTWFNRVHPDDLELLQMAIQNHLEGNTRRLNYEHRVRDSHGQFRWVVVTGKAKRDASGKAVELVGTTRDITDLIRTQQQLHHDAFYDPLTGLANKYLFRERLSQAVNYKRRNDNYKYSVLLIDCENFKGINDLYGNEVGDEYLKAIATRLKLCCRDNDTIARFTVDEFAVLAVNSDNQRDSSILADRILSEFERPFLVGNQLLHATLSIGIVEDTKLYEDPDIALQDADIALVAAKGDRSRKFIVYTDMLNREISQAHNAYSQLQNALKNNEMLLHFQPIHEVNSGKLIAYEALLRWQHPDFGIISPQEFIPLAEDTNLVIPMGLWALEQTIENLIQTQKHNPDLCMSVNVSRRQIESPEFVGNLSNLLKTYDVDPAKLWLEITESTLGVNPEQLQIDLHSIKALGVKLAIDDFGTGYSSLISLNNLPFDIIKIAKPFLSPALENEKSLHTIGLICDLAKVFDMQVIIEGVESPEQLNFLKNLNCQMCQGYLLGRPAPLTSSPP